MNEVKAETTGTSALSARTGRPLHPLPVRIMHWINAVVMLVMITSGWGIYGVESRRSRTRARATALRAKFSTVD
jgi:Ni,Fe-hydrogenase I cytochrome b subunit